MFQANTLEDRDACDVLIEAKEVGLYKTFDLDNVDLISQVGYEASIDAFKQVMQENRFEMVEKALSVRNLALKPKE